MPRPSLALALRTAQRRLDAGTPRGVRQPTPPPNVDAIAWAARQLHRALLDTTKRFRGESATALTDAIDLLEPELAAAYALELGAGAAATRARRTVATLLRRLPAIQRTLARDLQAAYDRDPAATGVLEIVLCYPGLRAVAIHRIAHALHRMGVPLIPRMLAESAHDSTGIDIHPGATIGPGFFIDHGTSVVIGETSVIGRNCTIYQGVTLGARRFDRHSDGTLRRGTKRHPTLRDGVTVYSNATILGGETVIGRGAIISAGVFVQESVAAGCTVRAPRTELVVARRKTGRVTARRRG